MCSKGASAGWVGLRGLCRDLAAYLVHVERPDLGDQRLERLLGQRAGLLEDDHAVPDRHDRGDRPDVELDGERVLGLGVDLAKDDVVVALGGLLVRRRERPTWPAPGRPEVHQNYAVAPRDLVKVLRGQRLGSHVRRLSDLQLRTWEATSRALPTFLHDPGERRHSARGRHRAIMGRCTARYW